MITSSYVAEQVAHYTQQDRQTAAAAHRLGREARAARRAQAQRGGADRPTGARSTRRWYAVFTSVASTAR